MDGKNSDNHSDNLFRFNKNVTPTSSLQLKNMFKQAMKEIQSNKQAAYASDSLKKQQTTTENL